MSNIIKIVRSEVLQPLVGSQCAATLAAAIEKIDTNIIKSPCFSLLISKVLGLGIIVGGSIVKLPQILKIVGAGSAQGISLVSYLLETFALAVGLAYNFRSGNPFSTYGETAFITAQNVIIMMLILSYSKSYAMLLVILAAVAGGAYSLISPEIVNESLLSTLQWSTIFIGAASKVPQIVSNFAAGSTGQLSAITLFLQAIGSAARIFTTMREVSDKSILTSFIVATTLNGILFLQVLIYWNKAPAASKGGKSEPKPKGGKSPKRTKKEL
ncbi:hypothetical protein HDV05_008646 [Chytridiales sp. JEL 0842]|nr:hypothetical protein HDV05_008646 [Chytridiales sp. JEL 0842]